MSTRSAIILEHEDGTARGIYCHFDGYPEHHKPILLYDYSDLQKVRELIDLGDISTLAPSIGTKHDFSNPPEGEVNAYGRDRGEVGVEAKRGLGWREVERQIGHNGHVYIYRASDRTWYYSSGGAVWVALRDLKIPERT